MSQHLRMVSMAAKRFLLKVQDKAPEFDLILDKWIYMIEWSD